MTPATTTVATGTAPGAVGLVLESRGDVEPALGAALGVEEVLAPARVFKALGDPVRLRMLSVIATAADGEACVCDVTCEFDLSQPTISHHLKILREAGLVTSTKRATWSYYRLAPAALRMVTRLLQSLDATDSV